MADDVSTEDFIRLLTEFQPQLRGFILASLGNFANSQDVLQRTNLTLWRKASEFRPGAPFLPWAQAIARFEILAFLRDHKRERLTFRPDVVELMSEASASCAHELPERQIALRTCLEQLPEDHRQILARKYVHNQPLTVISDASQRSIDGVKSLMLRIRKSLSACIEKKMASAD